MKAGSKSLILIGSVLMVQGCSIPNNSSAKLIPPALEARIAEIRMGDMIVKTKPGADVKVKQVRHEFLFGAAILNSLAEKGAGAMSPRNRKMYLKVLSENFNYAVHENALKWYDCEKRPNVVNYDKADKIWEMCNELNIPMRGHCIFWAKSQFVMPWLKKLNDDELREAIKHRAIGVTKHFKGRIEEFDLNNEMIDGDFFRSRLGNGIIKEMAYMAKEGNPDVTLYVNDYGILVDKGYNTKSYIAQIEKLLADGVPIDGIGCQGHMVTINKSGREARDIQKNLDRLAKFNLPIKITECLFDGDNDKERADALRMFFPICFAHPSVESILMWGFWEQGHWIPRTAMWKKDWTPTAQVKAYRDLVFNEWWTDTTAKADSKGMSKVRAFYGDYEITSNGKTKKVTLSKKDKSINVSFE